MRGNEKKRSAVERRGCRTRYGGLEKSSKRQERAGAGVGGGRAGHGEGKGRVGPGFPIGTHCSIQPRPLSGPVGMTDAEHVA